MGLLLRSWGGAVDTGCFCFSACLTSGNGGSDRRIALSFKLTWLSPVKFSIWANFGGRNVVPYPNMVRCHSPYNFHWLIYSPRRFFLFFHSVAELPKKKNLFWYAYHIGMFIDFQKCILYVTEGELCIYIYILMNFDWTFYCDFFTEKWVRKWYPASLKDKKNRWSKKV